MADTYQTFAIGAEVVAAKGGVSQLQTDLAVLVADAGAPTQAHVVLVANDVSKMLLGNAVNTSGVGIKQAALLVVVDTTVFATVSALRTAFNNVLAQAAGVMTP